MRTTFRRFVALLIGATLVAGCYTNTALNAQRITPEEAAALSISFYLDEDWNVYRRLGGTYILMTDAHVHQQLAQRGLREPLQLSAVTPPWAHPRYINHSRHNSRTSSALRDAMVNFYLREVPYFNNPFPVNWVVPPLNDNDLRVSANFTATFLQGFRNDAFSRTLPFNDAYLARLLNGVDFYFAARQNRWYWNGGDYEFVRAIYPNNGFFDHSRGVVFISATRDWNDVSGYRFLFYDRFARIAIHEVGHVLGLGESLAHLFEEKYMGLQSPLRPGNWERDSSFDRALLAMAGPEDFWNAAFTSNAAYGNLWDMHFGNIISFADLQTARGLAHQKRLQGNLPDGYAAVPGLFYQAFATGTMDVRRSLYITQAQLAVGHLNDFITEHNLHIAPILSVFDFKIYN